MFVLPTKPTKGKPHNPRKLLIAGQAKVGKTSLVMQLPNCLLLDLEHGGEGYDGMSFDVKAQAIDLSKKNEIPVQEAMLEVWFSLADQIRNSDHVYDFIAIDNTTRLEDLASYYATLLYKKSMIGKSFKGTDVVTELPNGGG